MLAIFGLAACIAFEAGPVWWLLGFVCLALDANNSPRRRR